MLEGEVGIYSAHMCHSISWNFGWSLRREFRCYLQSLWRWRICHRP